MVLFRLKRRYRRKSTLKRLARPRRTTAVMQLAKQIQGIKRSMKKESTILTYVDNQNDNIGTQIGNEVTSVLLSNIPSWVRTFGAGTDDEEANSMIWKSFGLDVHITQYDDGTNCNYTVFLVKCKDAYAPYINLVSGAITLTAGTHYYSSATGSNHAAGLTMINKKFFDIIAIRRFTLGNFGTAMGTVSSQSQYGNDRRMYFKVRVNKKIENPGGGWKGVPPQDPSSNYMLLVFNNNSTSVSGSPRLRWMAAHTVQV